MKDPNLIIDFELTAIKDISVLFSFEMMDLAKLPNGIHGYYAACDDEDWLTPTQISKELTDNFFGVVLSKTPLPLEENGTLPIDPGFDLDLFNSGMLFDRAIFKTKRGGLTCRTIV